MPPTRGLLLITLFRVPRKLTTQRIVTIFQAPLILSVSINEWTELTSLEAAKVFANRVSYPILVRPSTASPQRPRFLLSTQSSSQNSSRTLRSNVIIAVPGWYTDGAPSRTPLQNHILFVDIGYSSTSVAVVAFSKGYLIVNSAAYDRHLGGRDIDYALLQYFAEEFKTIYKIDVLSSPEATFCRIAFPLRQALVESGLSIDQTDLIGGTTRVPAVRARIQVSLSGKPLSTTLNQDEAVARGATFACAFFSTTFRVREYHVGDITQCPMKVSWDRSQSHPDEDTELVVIPRGNDIHSPDLFEEASTLGLHNVPADPHGDISCVKLETRLNLHGAMSFEAAYVKDVVKEVAIEVDGDAQPADVPKKKRVVKKPEVLFASFASPLESSLLEQLREQEAQMHAADKLVQDTVDRKDALEGCVYDTRGKLEDRYAAYVQPAETTVRHHWMMRMFHRTVQARRQGDLGS
ncbi:actin-like ATPase domain-containing protein [Imleria badia]|nr:actin-like ATPase domain-containing protein [Imleria badia]